MTQPSLADMVDEMRRLTALLLKANRRYLKREAEVIKMHAEGKQNYSGSLGTVLDNDLLLRGASGMAKTCAVLAGGLAQVIQAELAISSHERAEARRGNPGGNIVDMSPNLRGMLEAPIATRPQDWAQPARRQLFGERGREQA